MDIALNAPQVFPPCTMKYIRKKLASSKPINKLPRTKGKINGTYGLYRRRYVRFVNDCRCLGCVSGLDNDYFNRRPQPAGKKDVDIYGWAGFAAVEAIALYALVIALVMLTGN